MVQKNIHPVILCGGSGTRLWPLSRKSFPKQFTALVGDQSLFQETVRRLCGPTFLPPMVVTAEPFRFIVADQLAHAGVEADTILIEPEPRNTAPAILAAALVLVRTEPNALMLVAPSDHAIPDTNGFQKTVLAAVDDALAGKIVTFGVAPDRPETGYGYLELDGALTGGPIPLRRFVEKPATQAAKDMVDSARFLWNSGVFLMTARTLINAVQTYAPDMFDPVTRAVELSVPDLGFVRLEPAAWARTPAQSIDYAVMEKAEGLVVMPFEGAWSDLGEWNAVAGVGQADSGGNIIGKRTHAIDCESSVLRSEAEGTALVGIGLKDIIAVAMSDAVLVAHREHTQDVSSAVKVLQTADAPQAETFTVEHRPWGHYETLAHGTRFLVKRIVVHPGGALSLQSHDHRAEHWIVVEGTAKVTVGDTISHVSENQSIYVPVGAKHRLENPGAANMILIEVQTGNYLSEDDITRYEDVYARS